MSSMEKTWHMYRSCLGAYRGDSDFNPSMDADGDNIISPADLKAFCDFYDHLADDEYYELPQNVQNLDINLDGVINDTDYLLFDGCWCRRRRISCI